MGLKVGNLVTPSPEQWYVAIKGMRNPFKSRDKSDSFIIENPDKCLQEDKCNGCPYQGNASTDLYYCWAKIGDYFPFVLGKEDKKLLLNLCKAGDPSHRKILRQLPVIMDIKAPLYWWKEMDQCKVGTCTNSESTMHTLIKKEFEETDFSFDHYNSIKYEIRLEDINPKTHLIQTVVLLNQLRELYLKENNLETREVIWNQINELLPQSYLQKRTWTANYEVLVNIIQQRRNHKLCEWDELIEYWMKNVPYLKEIVEAIDGI